MCVLWSKLYITDTSHSKIKTVRPLAQVIILRKMRNLLWSGWRFQTLIERSVLFLQWFLHLQLQRHSFEVGTGRHETHWLNHKKFQWSKKCWIGLQIEAFVYRKNTYKVGKKTRRRPNKTRENRTFVLVGLGWQLAETKQNILRCFWGPARARDQ